MTTTEPLDLDLAPPPGGLVLHQSDRATVVWGDCTDPAVIAACPAGYGLLLVDPPYGIGYRSGWAGRAAIAGDDGTVDWPAILGRWTDRLANSRHLYVFGYGPEDLAEPLRLAATAQLVWDKKFLGQGDLTLPRGTSHELFTLGVHRKSSHDRAAARGALAARLRQGSVLRHPRPNGATRHPTEKPVSLMADLIESSTICGDLVVDPCAGSGPAAVAAILLGRRAWAVEIDRCHAKTTVARVRAAEKLAALIADA